MGNRASRTSRMEELCPAEKRGTRRLPSTYTLCHGCSWPLCILITPLFLPWMYLDPQTEPRMNVQRVLRVFSPEFHEYRIYRVYTLPSLLLEVMTYSRIIVIAPQQTSEFIQCCSSGCVFTIDLLGGDNLSEDHSCRRLILPLSAAINCRSSSARGKHCHTSHIHDTCQPVWSLCRCYLGGPYC